MMILIKKLAKEVKVKTPDLITRGVGSAMYRKMESKLNSISEEEVVILDFEGIRVIDASFVDEFIVKLVDRRVKGESSLYYKLKNISKIAQINIDSVFKTYSDYNNYRLAISTEDITPQNNFFIGRLTEGEENFFNYIRINKCVRFNDCVHYSGLSEGVIQETIDQLKKMGLVRSMDDGLICQI